ncbi:MAG: hypothetical protein ACR2LZ_06250 [Pyrinomonadaceae bacterium]
MLNHSEEGRRSRHIEAPFYSALEHSLRRRGLRLDGVCQADDPAARRVLEEYGAMFLAADDVRVPPVSVFTSDEEVRAFQGAATSRAEVFGSDVIELQPAALAALLGACADALSEGLGITPRGGAEAARRSFDDTLRLWDSRFLPALDYWCLRQQRLAPEQAARLRAMLPWEQVAAALELEQEGIFFSKDFSKSVLYSVAPPGASQHLSMLAFDVAEFGDPVVRQILARHGWFQTVQSDLPHFTYLGLDEDELPARGLRRVVAGDQVFWVPNVEEESGVRRQESE